MNHLPIADFSPSDYYLFTKMRIEIRSKKFTSDKDVKYAVLAYFCTKRGVLLHCNSPVHKSSVAVTALHNIGFDILNHSSYSPDFYSSDYYICPTMKKEPRS